jgi:protease IV
MTFFDYLKNIFFLLIFLQFLPGIFEGLRKQYGQLMEPRAKVGVISMKGVIGDSGFYTKQLTQYFKDPSIKAILIKMDSPGGAAGSGEAIYNELLALKSAPEFHKKPVITLVENTCASGAYYVACASDYIIAPASSLVGSIGATFPNIFFVHLREFLAQHKIGYKPLSAGAYKNSIDPFSDATPEQEAMLQGLLNDCYQTFAQAVAHSRKLSLNAKDVWANGRIFTGKQAKELGLIDEIGSAYNAIRVIKEKALIEGEIEWVKQPAPSSFSQFFGSGSSSDDDTSLFSTCINNVCEVVENRYCTNTVI